MYEAPGKETHARQSGYAGANRFDPPTPDDQAVIHRGGWQCSVTATRLHEFHRRHRSGARPATRVAFSTSRVQSEAAWRGYCTLETGGENLQLLCTKYSGTFTETSFNEYV